MRVDHSGKGAWGTPLVAGLSKPVQATVRQNRGRDRVGQCQGPPGGELRSAETIRADDVKMLEVIPPCCHRCSSQG